MTSSRNNSHDYLISIVIPVYNAEKDLVQCLESLINQDDQNFEVILVDDGSADNSVEVATAYVNKIKNFRIIKQPNAGSGGARNNGILHSKGEFILFLDSDDYVTQDYVSVLRNKQQSGNYNMVCGRYKLVNEEGLVMRDPMKSPPQFHPPLSLHEEILGTYERCVPWAKLFRKDEYLNANIIFPRKIPHEDWFFTYKLARKLKTIGFVEDKIYFWRQREGSTSKSMSTNHIDILPFLRNDTYLYLKQNFGSKREFALAARRNLIVTNNFRNRIRKSGETNLDYYAKLVCATESKILSDLDTYETSEFHDPTLSKTIRNIIGECKMISSDGYLSSCHKSNNETKNAEKHTIIESPGNFLSKTTGENAKLRLSLISPSYNQASYVSKMIKSIEQQSVLPYEHIVLDAGSNDGTLKILSDYEKSNSFVKMHIGRDNGQTNAINLGFLEATGEIISWLNTDDRYYSRKVIEKVLETFEKHPDVDIIYGRGNFTDADGKLIREAYLNWESDKLRYKFINSVGILQPALFMRRKVFEKIGPLSEKYNLCFDYEYWIRIANAGFKFFFLDEILCEAILHQDSKTIGQRSRQLAETAYAVKEHYGFVPAEWIHKLVDSELTGADGITTGSKTKSEEHFQKVTQYYAKFNHNYNSIAAILSMGHYSEVENTLKMMNSVLNNYTVFYATAFNSLFFHQGLTLIRHLQEFTRDSHALLVYDLGLNRDELSILKDVRNVYILQLPSKYKSKPTDYFLTENIGFRIFINWHVGRILPKDSLFLYMDPELVPVKDMSLVYHDILTKHIYLLSNYEVINNAKDIKQDRTMEFSISDTYANDLVSSFPSIVTGLVGYKIGGKYQELFDIAFDHFQRFDTQKNDNGNAGNILARNLSQQNIEGFMIDTPNRADTSIPDIKTPHRYLKNIIDHEILSYFADRFKAPIIDSASVLSFYSTQYDTILKKDKLFSNQLSDYELDIDLSSRSSLFINHKGLYANSYPIIFNLNRKHRALIMGNGPSVRGIEFDRLKDFDVFGMNAAYRFWDRINWYPQYYSCLDVVVGISHAREIKRLIENAHTYGIKKFLLLDNLIQELEISLNQDRVINFDRLKVGSEILSAPSVTTGSHTTAWASYLGYEEIYLIGIDSNYVEVIEGAKLVKGAVLQMETTPAKNPNYFFDDYQQKGDVYHIPNPTRPVHLHGWREVAGRLLASDSQILNANPTSKVDAFNFCHFNEIEKGKAIDIIPRERALINNYIIDSLKQKDILSRKPTLLFCGEVEGFNLKAFIAEGWQVCYIGTDQKTVEVICRRFEVEFHELKISDSGLKLYLNMNSNIHEKVYTFSKSTSEDISKAKSSSGLFNSDFSKHLNYLYFGPQSSISSLKEMLKSLKPEFVEIYMDDRNDLQLVKSISYSVEQLNSVGYSTYFLFQSSEHSTNNDFLFASSFNELPSALKSCCVYAAKNPLNLDSLLSQVSDLDIKHLYFTQKYGFSFENIYKTDGVTETNEGFYLNPPPGKNYIAFRYAGKVRPADRIIASVSFRSASSSEFKVMLCRDGSTPFEYNDKTVNIDQGIHSIQVEHSFKMGHTGVRIQIGSVSGSFEICDITTKLNVIRDGKNLVIDSSQTNSKIVKDINKTISEAPASLVNRQSQVVSHKMYLFYRKFVEYFFPENTKRRFYAALMKEKIVLFIQWVVNIFR